MPTNFMGYQSQPGTQYTLMTSVPSTTLAPSAAQGSSVEDTSVTMPGYGQQSFPRLTQVPVQSSLLSQYAPQHHS